MNIHEKNLELAKADLARAVKQAVLASEECRKSKAMEPGISFVIQNRKPNSRIWISMLGDIDAEPRDGHDSAHYSSLEDAKSEMNKMILHGDWDYRIIQVIEMPVFYSPNDQGEARR